MSQADERDERGWDAGWAAHTAAQRRRLARLTLGEKLQWLEGAQRLARRLAQEPKDREARASGGTESESPGD